MAEALTATINEVVATESRPSVRARIVDWFRGNHADWAHVPNNPESALLSSGPIAPLAVWWFHADENNESLNLWPFHAAGLVSLAMADVDSGRKLPSIAIDAGAAHHGLMSGWARLPKHPQDVRSWNLDGHKLELLQRGQVVQLSLEIEDVMLSEDVVKMLRGMVGAEGLRHWAAYLKQLSVEGNRQGHVRWTVDGHHKAMKLSASKSRNPAVRQRTVDLVNMFTNIFLVADKDKTTRRERPLVTVLEREKTQNKDNEWELDGMTLQINPLLYTGVRKENGKIGANFWPQSPQLPHIDHKRLPYAIGLGLILPARWRREAAKGKDHIRITGKKLIDAAGIRYKRNKPGLAWRSLTRTLKELHKRGCLGRIVVEGTPDTPDAMYCLYPPTWQSDRVLRKLRPIEDWHHEIPLTGAELRTWREKNNWTQAELAKLVGVARSTVARAEAGGEKRLTKGLLAKLSTL